MFLNKQKMLFCHGWSEDAKNLLKTPRGGPPPPHPFVLGRCGRVLGSWRSWRSWCLCVQMCKPSDSRQTLFDLANSHFLAASARPTWERSSEGLLEGVLEGRLRGNMPKNLQKSKKIVSRPSKIEPWSLQNGAWSPPRRNL